MLRAKGIRAAYGTNEIVHGVDIDLHPGEAVALLGPNGSGKSTLLKALAGLVKVRAGHALLDGKDLVRLDFAARAPSGLPAAEPARGRAFAGVRVGAGGGARQRGRGLSLIHI